jgi:hypothetical protein
MQASDLQTFDDQTFQEFNKMKKSYLLAFDGLEKSKMDKYNAQLSLFLILRRSTIILDDYDLNESMRKQIVKLLQESREIMYRYKLDALGEQEIQDEVCAVLQKTMKFKL